MSTNFPTALDALTNPAATDVLTGHAAQHSNANDAIEALQAKVGVNSSAVATSLDYKVSALESSRELAANKGVAGGYASLDGAGKVPAAQLPSYVDDVLEYANLAGFPVTGETAKIYVALDSNKVYRWSGSAYVEIMSSPGSTDVVTEGSTNLYFKESRVRNTVLSGISLLTNATVTAADSVLSAFGKIQKQITDHLANVSNPHSVTKAQVGLGNVDDTSDANKPVSTAQQSALNLKANLSGADFTGPASVTVSSASPALKITQTGTGNALVVEDVASDTTPFVIDQNGNVIVGATSSVVGYNGIESSLQVNNSSGIAAAFTRFTADSSDASIQFLKSRNATYGAHTVVGSGESLGTLRFSGSDGSAFIQAATIQAACDGTPGPNDMPGRLVFATTPDNSSTPIERMRIDSSGNVGIGGSPGTNRLHLLNTSGSTVTHIESAAETTLVLVENQTNTSSADIQFRKARGGYAAKSIVSSGDTLGSLNFAGHNGVDSYSGQGARIAAFVDGTPSASSMPGGIFFATTPSGATSATERMRIDSAGRVIDNAGVAQTPTRSTVASGSTISLTTATNHLLYDQSATVAALTVTLPSSGLVDGQIITIATRSAITALTVNGGTIYGAPTTLAAGGFASFIYSSGATAWFRKG